MGNEQEAQERVARVIHGSELLLDRTDMCGSYEVMRDDWKEMCREMADESITEYNAWMWEQVERPEVQEAVAKYMHPHIMFHRNGMEGYIDGEVTNEDAAAMFARWVLTALLGPRKELTDGN